LDRALDDSELLPLRGGGGPHGGRARSPPAR